MKFKTLIGPLLFGAASWGMASLAVAGAADMQNADGGTAKFEYEGDNLRINTGQDGSYMIINNNGMYMVSNAGGTPMVINAGKMMGMFGGMADTAPSMASSEVVSLKTTGKREAQAGIEGEVYELQYRDGESAGIQTAELLLSNDPRAKEMSRAINGFAVALMKAMGKSPEGANDLEEQMAKLDKGILRYGDDMRVTSISNRTIASDRFVLPAAATDFSGLSGLADAIKAQSGEQSERRQGRADEKTDEVIDEVTDEAVNNALDKALGKLFGK